MANYHVELSNQARKQLKKLDKQVANILISWMNKNLEGGENPRLYGKSLQGDLSNYWRYRVGNYRILSLIEDKTITIHVVEIGHRKEVYK